MYICPRSDFVRLAKAYIEKPELTSIFEFLNKEKDMRVQCLQRAIYTVFTSI